MSAALPHHWARLPEAGAVLGLRLLYGVHRWFGRWPFRIFLVPVIGYFFLTRAAARRASLEYLSRLDQTAGQWHLRWESFRHFLAFGESLLDKGLAWSGWIPPNIEIRGMEPLLNRLRVEGQGALLLVSHLGNPELSRAMAKLHDDVKITVLAHTRHAVKFNRFLATVNPRSQVDLIQVSEVNAATAVKLLERVESGHLVVIAADRVPVSEAGRVTPVRFLGRRAPFPVGPYVLAELLKVPVWLMFCLRVPQGYVLAFEPFVDTVCLPRRERLAALERLVAAYAARLEHYCRLAPLQWFNFYSFWNASPGDANTSPDRHDA